MFLETLMLMGLGAGLSALSLILTTMVKSRLALWRFQRKAPRLPILEGASLLGNHITGVYLRKNCARRLIECHEKYGKTFGWLFGTRPAVSSCDLDLIRTFVHDEPQAHVNRMPFNSTRREFEFDSIFTAQDDQWRRIRRAFAPALKPQKFKTPNVALEIQASIDKLLAAIESRLESSASSGSIEKQQQQDSKEASVEVNADDLVHRFQMNLIFSCFYKQTNLIDFQAEHDPWVDMVEESLGSVITNPIVRLCMTFPVLRPALDWAILNFHKAGVWRRDLMRFIKIQTRTGFEARRQLQELKKQGGGGANQQQQQQVVVDEDNFTMRDGTQFRRNIIDHVIDQFLDGKLTKDEYFNSSNFLFAAADKTAADSITHTIYQLAKHTEVQEKLRASLQTDGMESEYLQWVVNESLRLFPPVPLGCSRTVTRDMPLTTNDHDDQDRESSPSSCGGVVPAGTFVLTPAYVIHRLREYWGADAHDFKPERFADTSHHHPMQFIPFGAGIRSCPGKEFALHEMKMTFCALLLRYKFELSRPGEDVFDSFDSPLMVYTVPNSHTYIKLSRVVA